MGVYEDAHALCALSLPASTRTGLIMTRENKHDAIVVVVIALVTMFFVWVITSYVRAEQQRANDYGNAWAHFKLKCFQHYGKEEKSQLPGQEVWQCRGFTMSNRKTTAILFQEEYKR